MLTSILTFLAIWYGIQIILRLLIPKRLLSTAEFIWRGDPNITSYEPTLEKDFEERFALFHVRISSQTPPIFLPQQHAAIETILNNQKSSLRWLICTIEAHTKIKRIIVTLLFGKERSGDALVNLLLIGESITGTVIDLSHRTVLYSIKPDGTIEIS